MTHMLQIIHNATIGGAEKHTRLITKALARRGIRITFVYPPGPYAKEFASLESEGVSCIEFDIKKDFRSSVLFIRTLLKERKIDVIHSHMHGADFIAFCARIGLGVRQFSTVHYLPQKNPGLMFRLRSTLMTFIAYRFIEKIFAVSRTTANQMKRDMLLSPHRVEIAFNSIDFEEMTVNRESSGAIRRVLDSSGRRKILLSTGNLFRIKGQKYIIEALGILKDTYPDILLVLLGKGEDEQMLRELALRLNVSNRVVFAGYCLNVADWLAMADIYLQPSLIDAMPRALLEAMYMGLPVVVSDIANLREAVTHGENGLVAAVQSGQAVADALSVLLDNNDYAQRMGKAAREFVMQNCSMDSMARHICESLRIG